MPPYLIMIKTLSAISEKTLCDELNKLTSIEVISIVYTSYDFKAFYKELPTKKPKAKK